MAMDPKKLAAFVKTEIEKEGVDYERMVDDEEEEEEGDEEDLAEMVKKAAAKVEAGDGDLELMELTEDYDPDLDGNPPAWAANEAIWERAKKVVQEGDWQRYEEPWAVVAHVYKNMGGAVA